MSCGRYARLFRGLLGAVLGLSFLAASTAAHAAQQRHRPSQRSGVLAPRITCDLAPETYVTWDEELRFRVSARDPDGSTVSLTLLNPQPGLAFDPAVSAPSPATAEVRWHLGAEAGGRITLVFEARDALGKRTRLSRSVVFTEAYETHKRTADVTGDGVLDVIANASIADIGGVTDAGALYVWAGSSSPSAAPTATLTVPGAQAFDQLGGLGYASGAALQFGDVTGDGVEDIVCLAHEAGADGALYVFAGGPSLAGPVVPRATLTASGAQGLGETTGQALLLADVTGDGVLDLVVGAKNASVNGVGNTGAIYLYAGGPALTGTLAATRVLSVPGAVSSDFLGYSDGQGILIGDATGDGVLDVVASTRLADVGGRINAGAVYVWAGGSAPSASPTATLTSPASYGALIAAGTYQGTQLADVTGDGVLDVLAINSGATVAGKSGAGAVFVFPGGAGLAGALEAPVILADPAGAVDDGLGRDRGLTVRIGDVTGDGLLDVVAPVLGADLGGVVDVGAVKIFSVGSLTGLVAPRATLAVPGAISGDRLGYGGQSGEQLVDLTHDGVLDVVVNTTLATIGGVPRVGALYVFAGGALSGTVAPLATLTVPGAVAEDMLGDSLANQGFTCLDLTGDGTLDIVALADNADVGGISNTGAIYLFAGDAGFAGAMSPRATLVVPGANANDQLGFRPPHFGDVTADGTLDVVAGTRLANLGGVLDTGAIHVFAGSSTLLGTTAPTATLTVAAPVGNDHLDALQLADVTGDGKLDIVGHAYADVNGVVNAGALFVYPGGSLAGTVLPSATLVVPGAQPGDPMYLAFVADLTGDGVSDVLGASPAANIAGVLNAGALYLWSGTLSGTPAPLQMTVPDAHKNDQLGY